jgi:hypothetical protein
MAETSMTATEKARMLETRLESWKRRLKKTQEGSEVFAERLTGTVMAVAGGATAGLVWSKFGNGLPGSAKIGNTSIEIDTALGLIAVGVAAMGAAGKHSAELGTFGGGILAARTAAFVGKVMEEHEQKKAA